VFSVLHPPLPNLRAAQKGARPREESNEERRERKTAKTASRSGKCDADAAMEDCDECGRKGDVLARCRTNGAEWRWICVRCWRTVSGGVVDGAPHVAFSFMSAVAAPAAIRQGDDEATRRTDEFRSALKYEILLLDNSVDIPYLGVGTKQGVGIAHENMIYIVDTTYRYRFSLSARDMRKMFVHTKGPEKETSHPHR